MFLPTSISAISLERISNAVPLFSPFSSTVLDIESGFSKTASYVSLNQYTYNTFTNSRNNSSCCTSDKVWYIGSNSNSSFARTSIPSLATADNFPSIVLSITLDIRLFELLTIHLYC